MGRGFAVQGLVRGVIVVAIAKVVQLLLQHPKRFSLGLLGKVKLQSLVKALNLALSLWMTWRRVLPDDA